MASMLFVTFVCVIHFWQYNGFEKTIIYAISLGGDTDTIATMAGAIAGAYYGIDAIPASWRGACEGIKDALGYAEKLHKLAFKQQGPDQHHSDSSAESPGDGTKKSRQNTAAVVGPDVQEHPTLDKEQMAKSYHNESSHGVASRDCKLVIPKPDYPDNPTGGVGSGTPVWCRRSWGLPSIVGVFA